jgi:hypothetical protein
MRRTPYTLFALAAVLILYWHARQPARHVQTHYVQTRPDLEKILRQHVDVLARSIGERPSQSPDRLDAAARYIKSRFEQSGYTPESRWFEASGHRLRNIVAVRPGRGAILVVGAHYDTVPGSPGADDNASAVAVLLELARKARYWPAGRPIYFVAFSNEEARRIQDMGSAHFVQELQEHGEHVESMISLEMLGYYDERPSSQKYPLGVSLFYPSKGNFVGLVSNLSSRSLLQALRRGLRPLGPLTFSSAVLPSFVGGIDRSDHTNFWQAGIPAVMVTDTAFYRNPHYHRATDTADTLNYAQMALLTQSLSESLARYVAL